MSVLRLTIRLLSDRYHGRDWPPSPARVFQALVAGAKNANGHSPPEHDAALEWLERLDPPEILARRTGKGQAYTIFVPNNSLDPKSKFPTNTKTSKRIEPRLIDGRAVGEADLIYRWTANDADELARHGPALDAVAARLRALGWGVDFAAARFETGDGAAAPGLDRYVQAPSGEPLPTPVAGLLADLTAVHLARQSRVGPQGVDPYIRPTKFRDIRYRRAVERSPPRWVGFSLQTPDEESFVARWDEAAKVSAWLRHAAGQAMLQEFAAAPGSHDRAWIDAYVMGHTEGADMGRRLSYIPLPSVGHRHSDAGLRRVIVAEPHARDNRDGEALDLLRIKLDGWTLTEERSGTAAARLVEMDRGDSVARRYTGCAEVWRTVTPVVLPGFNVGRKGISLAKSEKLLLGALEAVGIDREAVAELGFQTAPYWPGAGAAGAMRVPRHLERWPRVHAFVRFREQTAGPLAAGLGRHYGIGLFAAVRED